VLSPGNGTLSPNPLVIVPFSQVLRAWDASPPEVGVEGKPFVAELAPYTGGQSYSMRLPAVGIDALFENEPHRLYFVDYLRRTLQWGGFPGFESAGQRPKEIQFLAQELLVF